MKRKTIAEIVSSMKEVPHDNDFDYRSTVCSDNGQKIDDVKIYLMLGGHNRGYKYYSFSDLNGFPRISCYKTLKEVA